ncbi:cyclic nucleotide-binding domain-containing protein [Dyella sp. M7H15-1]|uniref:cyclic nucleotide-binding and patatin-like phospholipase domain-containing protein n=1 Tax=Dyella sp. M7H15-1 TaxID=2501295 RepID=UPI0010051A51|nr:cyclic nucleotide-binding and patatin-like phospholipase domain-containing protein [Dyella sp. M7H15-1]QAU24908.1 cyclic nucleotide-binding domain-containing protein [Dyella sp. M7H15-1]
MKQYYFDIIKACSTFVALDAADIASLASLAVETSLASGEALMYKGDTSRDLYIVISGQLVATTGTRVCSSDSIGQILPGEVVGEMSLLTGEPRSLSVLAVQPSVLLKISYDNFTRYCRDKPGVALKLLETVASRTQGVIRHFDKSYAPKFIALVATSLEVALDPLIARLQMVLNDQCGVVALEPHSFDGMEAEHVHNVLFKHKHNADIIIYPVTQFDDPDKRRCLLQQAEKIVICANGSQTFDRAIADVIMLQQLQSNASKYKKNPCELVFLYPQGMVKPCDVDTWLDTGYFSRHHYICLNSESDIRRLARFLTGNAIGLVLGGGGVMRGWAHLGVLKYMLEHNIQVDAIGGTSIGGIVAACYLLSSSYEEMVALYRRVSIALLETTGLRGLVFPVISLYSGKAATVTGQQIFGSEKIEHLRKPFFCVSCNLTQKREEIHMRGLLWECLRATASIPGIIPPVVLHQHLHVDGGVMNNLPVNVMSNLLESTGTVLAVSLSNYLPKEETYCFPPIISFWESMLIKMGVIRHYRIPEFFSTFLEALLMGSHRQIMQNMHDADILLVPDLEGYSTLSRKGSSEELIERGYQCAQKFLNHFQVPLS